MLMLQQEKQAWPGKKMYQIHQSFLALTFFCCLALLSQSHFTASKSDGLIRLQLIPIDSLEPQNLNESQKFHGLVEKSKRRASYLKSISTLNSSVLNPSDTIPITMNTQSYLYFINIGIGRPITQEPLLVDTASDLIWTQCQPCINCFPQTSPIYDPRQSATYGRLPCNDPSCENNREFSCVNDVCVYDERYVNGASTKGIVSEDLFFFFPDSIPEFLVFGCSDDNQGFHFGQNNRISGILGLSMSPLSLISQIGDDINHKFSYCLVYPLASSTLTFGDVDTSGLPIQSTPFVTPQAPGYSNYYLNLIDVSIGTHRMMFPPNTFAIRDVDRGLGGCIMDSGSAFTSMERTPYRQVLEQFMAYFERFHLIRVQTATGFELCYRQDPNFTDYPSMTLHFQGADWPLPKEYVYIFNTAGEKYFCVALLPDDRLTIIGAYHQQNVLVIYEVGNNQLQFAPVVCKGPK